VIAPSLLEHLRCPVERTPVAAADQALLARLNRLVAAGRLMTRGGQPFDRALDGAVVNAGGTIAYGVFDGIPNMIVDDSIPLDQLGDDTAT